MPNPPLPTPEQLEAWGALCEQATPGPWRMVEDSAEERTVRASGPIVAGVVATVRVKWVHEVQRAEQVANALFIATARTALPTLLAAYRALPEKPSVGRDEQGREWNLELAWCVECPDCGFLFAAVHTDSTEPNTYSCPNCATPSDRL